MSFSAQIPGSITLTKYEFNENEMPSAGGTLQRSCYSFIEKISGLSNPVSLQHDVMYANAFAAVLDRNDLSENETPLALGCVGHQVDKEFPLESKTLVPLPLIMYPSETNGDKLDEVDMCSQPVLNWESYVQDIKTSQNKVIVNTNQNISRRRRKATVNGLKEISKASSSKSVPSDEAFQRISGPNPGNRPVSKRTKKASDNPLLEDDVHQCSGDAILNEKRAPRTRSQTVKKIIPTRPLRKMLDTCQSESKSMKTVKSTVSANQQCQEIALLQDTIRIPTLNKEDKLSILTWGRLKNQPKLRIEGTWNYLYGGYNGACCFMKDPTSKKLYLYSGKGSQLRAVELIEADPSSIFTYKVDSIWDEDLVTWSAYVPGDCNRDLFDELIFQTVPNEQNKLLGVRRGRSIQIYNTEDPIPDLLESIPNVFYGTSDLDRRLHKQSSILTQNPLLRGFDINPTFAPEIISIDENCVVRVCDINTRSTVDQFILPNLGSHEQVPEGYPVFKLNDAIGVSFTNYGQLFYAWGNSIVYLGDRRSKKYSRAHLTPLFDLRNHVHSHALSSQNHFHEKTTILNEYTSSVRASKRDPYYYVGTTSKIYLMDLRVPSHPVLAVNHGLQSPLAYMNICSGEGENFETVVAGSQRSSETVCLISDLVHLECISRPGCKGRHPLLHGYPRHLSSSKSYFDAVVNEGYDFPHPADHDLVKRHFYAWPTGLAIYPMISRGDTKSPGGILVATSNNFGDVFWQEWDQKPLPPHRKTTFEDHKWKTFVMEWHNALKTKLPVSAGNKSSKNPKKCVDSTILLEPLAKGIEKLTRVRDSPFNCFKPDQVQNDASIRAMIPVDNLCEKLSQYQAPQVEGIINVWRESTDEVVDPETIDLEEEEVEVKVEPHEPLSPIDTIEIDVSDNEKAQGGWDVQQELAQIERDLHNTLNFEIDENLDDFTQPSQVPESAQWTDIYTDMFESSQPFTPSDDIQNLYSSQPSSSRPSVKRTQKARKAGFL